MWRIMNLAIIIAFVLALGPSLNWVFFAAIAVVIASMKLLMAIAILAAYVILWWLFTRVRSAIRRNHRD